MARTRLDAALVQRGLFANRSQAQAAISAGTVRVNGELARKPSQAVTGDDQLTGAPAHPYVSRGGVKLAAALEHFGLSVDGQHVLDIGSSTGGFTDVALQRGASHVTAVDVGRGQLRPQLRDDPRVTVMEGTDIRHVSAAQLAGPHGLPSFVTVDVSFIGLEKALAPIGSLLTSPADLVALFKPQFQVGRDHVGKGGIVTDMSAIDAARQAFQSWLSEQGWLLQGSVQSPIKGSDGNQEILIAAHRGR